MSGCMVTGCDGKHYGLGLCNPHYQQFRLYGRITRLQPGIRRGRPQCSVEGCSNPIKAKGLCNMHRLRMKRHGDVHVTKGWGPDRWKMQ